MIVLKKNTAPNHLNYKTISEQEVWTRIFRIGAGRLIPRRELRKKNRKGSVCFYSCFIFWLGNVCWTFNFWAKIRLFETFKMSYPP